jgi:hypothetical protein
MAKARVGLVVVAELVLVVIMVGTGDRGVDVELAITMVLVLVIQQESQYVVFAIIPMAAVHLVVVMEVVMVDMLVAEAVV